MFYYSLEKYNFYSNNMHFSTYIVQVTKMELHFYELTKTWENTYRMKIGKKIVKKLPPHILPTNDTKILTLHYRNNSPG
jgi:hypothetical protein